MARCTLHHQLAASNVHNFTAVPAFALCILLQEDPDARALGMLLDCFFLGHRRRLWPAGQPRLCTRWLAMRDCHHMLLSLGTAVESSAEQL